MYVCIRGVMEGWRRTQEGSAPFFEQLSNWIYLFSPSFSTFTYTSLTITLLSYGQKRAWLKAWSHIFYNTAPFIIVLGRPWCVCMYICSQAYASLESSINNKIYYIYRKTDLETGHVCLTFTLWTSVKHYG